MTYHTHSTAKKEGIMGQLDVSSCLGTKIMTINNSVIEQSEH